MNQQMTDLSSGLLFQNNSKVMVYPKHLIFFAIALLVFINCFPQTGQPTIMRGLITDSVSNEPIPSVYVMFMNSTVVSTTNEEGVFSIQTSDTFSYVKISSVGYQDAVVHTLSGKNQFTHIKLAPKLEQLKEVVVSAKRKQRYRNKGNPAVELIEEVIKHKAFNRIENIDYLEYNKYQKIILSLDHVNPKLEDKRLMKHFRFVLENTDTTIIPGIKLLPVYLKEDLSNYYYRKNPLSSREIITTEKLVSFDEYIDSKSLTASINYLYHDIDIYNNNIDLLGNQFLSPIAPIAPSFYRFFIEDTVVMDSSKCIRLAFAPRNKSDFLFQGYLFVTLDSLYAVKKVAMHVNKEINMNWVKSIAVDQDFKNKGMGWMLARNEMIIDFGITKNSMGLYGQKTIFYSNYKINGDQKDSKDAIFNEMKNIAQKLPLKENELFWQQNRPVKLRVSEQNVYVYMDSLRNLPAFKRDMNIILLLTLGFEQIGPIEIGPTTTLYSYNPVEGSRIRLGVRTTRKFDKKLFLETYGAYGFTDQKFKSYLNAVYSLNDKSIREFPLKSIGISYQNDFKIPGEELQYAQSDNIILSFKRGVNDKMVLNKSYRIAYLNEFVNHFSYSLVYENRQLKPAGNLHFNLISYGDYFNEVSQLKVGQLSLDLRYAPHEKFIQGSLYRALIAGKYPVMEVKFTDGDKWLGGDYSFENIQANISKRFNLSFLGYTDVELDGGKIFGQVPYPLLDIHRANQTYSYQPLSYNLMNFLEFVSDQYVALNVDHNFNGFFFNRIPLFKKLKFREAVTFKALYGSLSNTNNPAYHTDLLKFPADPNGNPLTFTLGKSPYMEAGFGITNIFRFFRVDYVVRLSYLNHPDISKSGIRFDYKFDF